MKTTIAALPLFLLLAATAPPAQAADTPAPGERAKAVLNAMVQSVKAAEDPAAKREVISRFLVRAERNARMAARLPFHSRESRAALEQLQEKFAGFSAEVRAAAVPDVPPGVADADLDAFASFVQQDLEQAAISTGQMYVVALGLLLVVLLVILL